MHFEKGFLYHIYNQGNNHRKIYFNDENYLFFLKKIKTYITPHADILAWCLMPNHFHLMVLIRETEIVRNSQEMTVSHPLTKELKDLKTKTRTINDSIAIMLRSYTRAINKQENFSGTLFRKATKSECINCLKGLTPSFIAKTGITQVNTTNPSKLYLQICFDYIHQNPVKAALVKRDIDWEFSSARDYCGLRNGKLVNKTLAKEIGIEYSRHNKLFRG